MTSQDRIDLKAGAKRQILDNYKFYVLLSILWLALLWIGDTMYTRNMNIISQINAGSAGFSLSGLFSFAGLFMIVAAILRAGSLTMIDIDWEARKWTIPFSGALRCLTRANIS
ncbi:hypothetical protein L3X07_06800 [Levilactobacillus brevis]|nr:hypothetical protein [Levilactobacillus brevis]